MNKAGIYLYGEPFAGWSVVLIDESGNVRATLAGPCPTAEEALQRVMVASNEPILIRLGGRVTADIGLGS